MFGCGELACMLMQHDLIDARVPRSQSPPWASRSSSPNLHFLLDCRPVTIPLHTRCHLRGDERCVSARRTNCAIVWRCWEYIAKRRHLILRLTPDQLARHESDEAEVTEVVRRLARAERIVHRPSEVPARHRTAGVLLLYRGCTPRGKILLMCCHKRVSSWVFCSKAGL